MVAWWHQAITWTKADLSFVSTSDIHLRVISQEIPLPSIAKISLENIIQSFILISQWPIS